MLWLKKRKEVGQGEERQTKKLSLTAENCHPTAQSSMIPLQTRKYLLMWENVTLRTLGPEMWFSVLFAHHHTQESACPHYKSHMQQKQNLLWTFSQVTSVTRHVICKLYLLRAHMKQLWEHSTKTSYALTTGDIRPDAVDPLYTNS